MKQWKFSNIEQVNELKERILNGTNTSVENILSEEQGIKLLGKMKFEQSGYDVLLNKKTNFIEQINQTFTYLVCLAATEKLLLLYPEQAFIVNFGVMPGHDVISEDESIICECFAATTPNSNGKLEKDVKKVYENKNAIKKYVIFYAATSKSVHVENIRKKYEGIEIVALNTI
ncbi:hypothetical protein KPL47_00755 [Clostridium estertheticum]|uniref:hypothetical protein n=1 Tax=Clostridium estertheticum TaxID=238834 RepID=UPI001C0BBBE2|nr:hypothetical protein [Clostridium estertheticum]MBU3174891.1 hypothetical protein [Clostridium estertheticum]